MSSSATSVARSTASTAATVASSSGHTTTAAVAAMDIGEAFRPEDISKGDFFDFVSDGMKIGSTTAAALVTLSSASVPTKIQCSNNSSRTTNGSNNNGISTASLNNGHDSTNGTTSTSAIDHQQQPLQGYDQFWGTDKDPNRLDAGVFEDLNRFCLSQQQQQQSTNSTDGQIYTLTVLNGSEQWMKKEMTEPTPLPLDLDTLLGGFPTYIKSEYSYEDSGFGTDKPEDLMMAQHQNNHLQQHQQLLIGQHPHSPLPPVTVNPSNNSTNLGAFHDPNHQTSNNNSNTSSGNHSATSTNDWQMTDHNHSTESTAESLLRSALQGKGYGKGNPIQLQNELGIMVSPTNLIKGGDDELRRVMFVTDPESLGYADSTLNAPLFDDPTVVINSSNPNSLVTTSNLVHHVGGAHSAVHHHHHVDDDMFLSLDNAFSDDFEKIKRIATEVQQFCTNDVNNNQEGYPSLLNIDSNNNHSTPLSPTKMNINNNSAFMLNLNEGGGGTTIKGSGKVILNNLNGNNCQLSPYMTNSSVIVGVGGCPISSKLPTTPTQQKISSSSSTTTNKPKKYKRMNSNNANGNNNNSSNCSNLNLVGLGNGTETNNGVAGIHTSPCNGQRKDRLLHFCSMCSKGFKDKYSVNVHLRTHTGEKPFSCSLCGKSFRQKAHLAKHYQTHIAQKNNSGEVGSFRGHKLKVSKKQENLHIQNQISTTNSMFANQKINETLKTLYTPVSIYRRQHRESPCIFSICPDTFSLDRVCKMACDSVWLGSAQKFVQRNRDTKLSNAITVKLQVRSLSFLA